MNDEQNLRDRFEEISVPPTRLEVDALVEVGRRRAFRRRSWQAAGGVALATGLLVAVPTLVIGDPAPPPPVVAAPTTPAKPTPPKACKAATLRMPAGVTGASANGVDPSGRYVIGHYFKGQDFQPLLWTDGKPGKLPLEAPSMQLTSVNVNGVVAGLAEGPNLQYAFRYENGRYTRLRTPPGLGWVYPYPAMNAAGDIVINAKPEGESSGENTVGLLYKAGTSAPIKLPLPANSYVYDITDDGTIVGALKKDGVNKTAYAWDRNGRGRELKSVPGTTSIVYSAEGDWATGGLWPKNGDATPARWNLRTGELTQLKTGEGPGLAVNSDGWVLTTNELIRDGANVALPTPANQEIRTQGVSGSGLVVGHTVTVGKNAITGPRTWQC
ncbi:hypothetical protein [Actinoplanes solisilvae]|uniref:hypothetical protein n=1 Tax=Actinoplanes solisilvae TaxID=2486853 RepID=UPI000FDAA6A8|nr:hypothetical protein [Actinoplanes solisilvae]